MKQFDATPVAVVGLACRFPNSNDATEFWTNLSARRDCVREIPAQRWDWTALAGDPAREPGKTNSRWGGFLTDVDQFDPLFFKMSPTEAAFVDPQQRLILETAWQAIDDAGYRASELAGRKIGVYVGVSKNDYAELMRERGAAIPAYVSTGTVHSIIANRLSYLLDLRGPSEVVDTACSSALVALHHALRDIRLGSCEAALVGGVNALLSPTMYISHGQSGMLSPRGRCRTFDQGADGYVRGEGVGVVMLKALDRALADNDRIIGVIRGAAVNHGGRANSLTTPSVDAQADVIERALADAGVPARSISYVEAHGTGTSLGDPVEVRALTKAFGGAGRSAPWCGLGSVKTNIGHLESAAGIAGLIKLLLCLEHRRLPGLLHFESLNPFIELDGTPFYIADEARAWEPAGPRRAGLSAFGMGGVNAHVIVEEGPAPRPGQRQPLPGRVFARRRCWFEEPRSRPQVKGLVLQATDTVLVDHVVAGQSMLPGVAYLEAARALIEAEGGPEVVGFEDVYWLRPLRPSANAPVRVELQRAAGGGVSLVHGEAVHMSAVPVTRGSEDDAPSPAMEIAMVERRCHRREAPAELYQRFASYGLDYGPSFRVIASCVWREGELLTRLERGSDVAVGGPSVWDPALLDGVFQSVVALELLDGAQPRAQRVPYGLDALRVHAPLPSRALVHVRREPSRGPGQRFSMRLCAETGEVCVSFEGFVKRPLDVARDQTSVERPAPYGYSSRLLPAPSTMHCEAPARVLLISADADLARALRREPTVLTWVRPRRRFAALDADSFELDVTSEPELDRLLETLVAAGTVPDAVVLDAQALSLESSEPMHATLELCRALVRARLPAVRVLYVHEHPRELGECAHAMVGGFARTLLRENPQVQLTAIGCDAQARASVLATELTHYADAPMCEVEHREGRRLVRTMIEAPQLPRDAASALRRGGRYLISGGAGALGMACARFLAEAYGARLILLGRSPMSAPIQARLDELAAAGGEAIYMEADVSDRAQVEGVFAELTRRGLSVDGILHAAGLIEDAYILRKTAASFDRVCAPKVAGALNLDVASVDHPLELFVLFSSIASLMPNQGQCDYAAANAFLDRFAAQREAMRAAGQRRGLSLAINWPLWAEGGISVSREEEEHLWRVFGMRPMETSVALAVFERLLREPCRATHYAPIEGDRVKIAAELRATPAAASDPSSAPSMADRLEAMIDEIVTRAPGQALDAGAHSPTLVEAGLDSLAMIRLAEAINRELGAGIKPSIFFEFQTFAALAAHLDEVVEHPRSASSLIDGRRASSSGAPGFRKRLHNEVFFMRDHVVEGQFNVPGACFVEMALQAARLERGRVARRLINNLWVEKLSSTDAPIEIEIALVEHGGGLGYEIARTLGDERTIHALGDIEFADPDEPGLGRLDLDEILRRCPRRRVAGEVYPQIIDEGLDIGASIMPLTEIHFGADEALARLRLPASLVATVPDYTLHPTLLTGVLQTALLLNKPEGSDGSQYIPVAIDALELDGPLPAACYVHCRPEGRSVGAVRKFEAAIADLEGRVVAHARGLSLRCLRAPDSAGALTSSRATPPAPARATPLQVRAERVLAEVMAEAIGVGVDELDADQDFEAFGVSSIMIVELNRRLEDRFGRLSKTLFFEYRNLRELAAHFVEAHAARVSELAGGAPPASAPPASVPVVPASVTSAPVTSAPVTSPPLTEDQPGRRARARADADDDAIAIIGLAGRYPGADDLDEFWRVLDEGRDCVTEIPAERFAYEHLYDPDRDQDKIYARWGGFIRGVEEFDPRLFNITPRDAARIDPQERLFLQVVWETLEDAGYTPASIAAWSRKIGVFVGALWQPYVDLGVELTMQGEAIGPSGLLYSIPNRASYFFDWIGPSLAIDTACSGSLTALHYAVQSLARGECEGAVVGGVNLSLSSSKYLFLAQNQFLASDGRCRSFGAGGDGYVPGEGVGAVLLKRLADARRDGDRIDAVIRSTRVNHGGRTSGYTVPNPNQQAALIADALVDAELEPRAVSYVEAHGTGTALGDPIEITGLTKAFGSRAVAGSELSCAIGSVKSNIGHLEAAAGIAGLTKIVLQLRHETLAPSLHAAPLNPNLDLERTPFRVQQRSEPWARPVVSVEGQRRELPRVALLSSFGAGGSNAHAVVCEHVEVGTLAFPAEQARIIVLSTRSPEQLRRYAARLADALERQAPTARYSLADIASTLQTGRSVMAQRAAVVVDDVDGLIESLRALAESEARAGVVLGSGRAPSLDADLVLTMARRWLERGEALELARAWVAGLDVDWRALAGGRARPVSLPTYPFERLRCWLPEPPARAQARPPGARPTLHPLVHENVSSLDRCVFRSRLASAEFILADHHIHGRAVLPAVVQLEMVRHAAELAGASVHGFRRVIASRPITASGPSCEVEVELERGPTGLSFALVSGEGEARVSHTTGVIVDDTPELDLKLDLRALEAAYTLRLSGEEFYDGSLRGRSVELGPGLRNIQEVWRGHDGALARIATPAGLSLDRAAWTQRDAILQLAGMLSPEGRSFIPFELGRVDLLGPAVAQGWVHVRTEDASPGRASHSLKRFGGVIADHEGRVVTRFTGIVTRDATASLSGPAPAPTPALTEVVHAVPVWIEQPRLPRRVTGPRAQLLTCGIGALRGLAAVELLANEGWMDARPQARLEAAAALTEAAMAAFDAHLRRSLTAPSRTRQAVVVALPDTLGHVAGALAALARNVSLEHPSIQAKIVTLAPAAIEHAADLLASELDEVEALEVRYASPSRRLVRGWDERRPNSTLTSGLGPFVPAGRYWITGGLGGLGRILARELAERCAGVRLLLSGRSLADPGDVAFLGELRGLGAEVEYLRADVCDPESVAAVVNHARARLGGLDGIVHAAGVIHDAFFATKDPASSRLVLAPKLEGTVNLERATRDEPLAFLILFGSLAAVVGNAGQSDYAAANAFMAGFGALRRELEDAGERQGRCVTVHWPLWSEGGMTMTAATAASFEARTGFQPMPTRAGLDALARVLELDAPEVLVGYGALRAMRDRSLGSTQAEARSDLELGSVGIEAAPACGCCSGDTREALEAELRAVLAELTEIPAGEIEARLSFGELGLESVSLVRLANSLRARFELELSPTLFFEYPTLDSLVDYFAEAYGEVLARRYAGPTSAVDPAPSSAGGGRREAGAIADELRAILAELTELPADEVEARLSFGELGLDSVALVRLASSLSARFELELSPTLFFEYPTLEALARYFDEEHAQLAVPRRAPPPAILREAPMLAAPSPGGTSPSSRLAPTVSSRDIAVIGMSGRFAGAADVEQLWTNLCQGREHISEVPPERFDVRRWHDPDPTPGADAIYCPWGSFVDDAEGFDAAFFGVTPREATRMDPQLRLVLHSVYHTAEDAGVVGSLYGTDTGVFVGACFHDHRERLQAAGVDIDPTYLTGVAATSLANRVSFFFDLRGPSLPFDTACSSSLFALDAACAALRAGDCSMALVAGVNLILSSTRHRYFSSLGALSRTGRCHSFDQAADGYVPGEAVASILLKPLAEALADGDRIHGVIKGSATRHSGRTATLTAPSVDGEVNVLLAAWRDADIEPATLSYVEAHGTGTALGDPIEVRALQKAFAASGSPPQACTLGSAKASLGHTEGAAGIVGVVKVLLQLRHGERPAMPGFETLNSRIDLSDATLRINGAREAWPVQPGPRRAGVSSFGFTGAYAHVVVEEHVDARARAPRGPAERAVIVPLAAKTDAALQRRARDLAEHLRADPALSIYDVAHTLARREPLARRVAFTVGDLPQLQRELERFAREGSGGEARFDWPTAPPHPDCRLVSLPGYPFAATPYRLDPATPTTSDANPRAEPEPRPAATTDDQVAIIGLSGRFPMAEDLVALFDRLAEASDCVSTIPEDRWDPAAHRDDSEHGRSEARWGGFLDRVDTFDYERFNLSFRDAVLAHPEERLLLEEAWSCFESAAHDPQAWLGGEGGDVGVFIGASFHEYPFVLADLNRETGAKLSYSSQTFTYANRLSYYYNLRGPSVVVDSACSSSLYAIFSAYEAVRAGRCRMALAGGVNLSLHPSKYAFLNDRNFLSRDGRCRAFAEGGDGYVPGEGVGLALLKPLADALRDGDPVLGVIRGAAAGNDGRTHGFTVPNPNAQRETITRAHRAAGVDPHSVSCVECHGTGTSLGDPIEVAALRRAFGPDVADRECALSSIKSNIGHLEAAAGVAQIAKMVLQLGHGVLFPNLIHGEGPNPTIDLGGTPFHVATELREWSLGKDLERRRGGVSSFGAGGTNVHLVVEEAPTRAVPALDRAREHVVVLSADSEDELRHVVERLRAFLTSPSWRRFNPHVSVRDVAGTLQRGRAHRRIRLALICGESLPELTRRLRVSAEHLDGRLGGPRPTYLVVGEAETRAGDESSPSDADARSALELATRWVAGAPVDWAAFTGDHARLYLPSARSKPSPIDPRALTPRPRARVSVTGSEVPSPSEAPAPSEGHARAPGSATSTGAIIEAALREALGALPSSFDEDTDFAELGVDSILVSRIHALLGPRFPQLEAYALFEYPTLAQLRAHLDGSSVPPPGPAPSTTDESGAISALDFGQQWVPVREYFEAYERSAQRKRRITVHELDVGEGRALEVVSCGEGPPVVLLPPFNSTAIIWIQQLLHLSDAFQLIVVHYPGIGASDWDDRLASLDDVAALVARGYQRLRREGIVRDQPAQWVGWSLGGFIAQSLARDHAELVERLVLISTTTISWSSDEYQVSPETFSRLCAEEFQSGYGRLPEFIREHPRVRALEASGQLERFVVGSVDRRVINRYFRMIARFRHSDTARSITAPTYLLSGENDALMPAKFARRLSREIAGSEYHEVAGGLHFLSLFRFEDVNERLRSWLKPT